MDISDGENEAGAYFLDPIAIPEVVEGSTDEVIPQDNDNNAGEPAPAILMPSNGDHTLTGNARSSSNRESGMEAGQRPSKKGLHARTPRRNVLSSSSQPINFPELMQFMMAHAEEENHMVRRRHKERDEFEDRHCCK